MLFEENVQPVGASDESTEETTAPEAPEVPAAPTEEVAQ